MQTMLLSGLVVAATVSGALAGPKQLTNPQLDGITAGLAGITVTAIAVAEGTDGSYTSTTTQTDASGGEYVDLARGSGFAIASGDLYQDATVETELYGDGDIVVGQTYEADIDNPQFSAALGGGVVVAITPPD